MSETVTPWWTEVDEDRAVLASINDERAQHGWGPIAAITDIPHAHLFRRSVRAALSAMPRPDDALREAQAEIARLREAFAKIMPIRVHDGPDYAEVYFSDGQAHSTQAMTMNPQDWLDIAAALTNGETR